MPPSLVDSRGASLSLGQELGRGGEGVVYDIPARPGSVAKVYLSPPGRKHAAKIAAMILMANDRLLRLTAWPIDTIHVPGGQLVGFVMPKISGFRPAFELYGPKLRLQKFPKADWRFLIQAAANSARAFSVVHAAGHVIGDVNHGNLVVAQDATVRLIDCDSFQISKASTTWFCEVGVPTHQPPEMQGLKSYNGFRRTQNHDNFGLAVVIFQMLCLARHPFSGRYLGSGDAPPIEEAIRDFRYAYAVDTRATAMAPPPGSLPIAALTPRLRDQFERAFLRAGAQPGRRPTPDQWVQALTELAAQLKQCRTNQGHFHLSSLTSCPWCDIEGRTGRALFPIVFVPGNAGQDGFAVLWQQVTAIPEPDPLPPPPVMPLMAPSAEATRIGRDMRRRGAALATTLACCCVALITCAPPAMSWAAVIVSFATLFVLHALMQRHPKVTAYRRGLKKAAGEWRALMQRHQDQTHQNLFRASKAEADGLKRAHDALLQERADRLRKLHENHRQSQLEEYLDRFEIATARIKGIGPAKVTILQSYGIETALDVNQQRVLGISGFGPKTVANLLAWRQTCEQSFRFDPQKGVSPTEVAAVEQDVMLRVRGLEARLAKTLEELKTHAANEQRRRADCATKIAGVGRVYGQLYADVQAATRAFC